MNGATNLAERKNLLEYNVVTLDTSHRLILPLKAVACSEKVSEKDVTSDVFHLPMLFVEPCAAKNAVSC